MADTDQHLVIEQMTSTIKLTGSLISAIYEYLWGIEGDAPAALPKLIDALQAVGKALSALRKYSIDDTDVGASVLQRLNAKNGPVADCAAELRRLSGKIASGTGDGGLRTMVEKGDVMSYIGQLEKHRRVFALALKVLQDHWKLSKEIGGYIQERDSGVVELDDPFFQNTQVLEKGKEHLSWLYSGDYESGWQGVLERSAPGTGEWIKQSPVFQNWMTGTPGSRNLCGTAIRGAGKTHISARIIQQIQALPQTSKYAVAFFFFPLMEPGQTQPKDVLRCLIFQLACQALHFVRVSRVLHLRLESQGVPPTFDKLSRSLIDTSRVFDRVFLVLNGLDEYEHQGDLVPLFRTMATENISLFVTTNLQGLGSEYSFLTATKIDLSARAEDIKTYIQWRIERYPNAKYLLGQGANRDKFVSDLMECADGRFLYVHLVIQPLLQQPTVHHIFSKLQDLKPIPASPSLLQQTMVYSPFRRFQNLEAIHSGHDQYITEVKYNTIYTLVTDSILTQPKNRTALALKILLWVVKANETLTVGALREAIAVTDDASEIPNKLDSCDQQTMVDVCEGLITIDDHSGKVRLVHDTARDCLLGILPVDADYQMVVACLSYLSHNIFSETASPSPGALHQSLEDRLKAHPFYDYVAKHLSVHINACDLALTNELFIKFTRNEGQIKSYFQAHGMSCSVEKRLPLRIAIHVGHLPVVRQFLDEGIDPFSGENGQHPLHWAVCGNQNDIVQLLVDRWKLLAYASDRDQEELWYSYDEEGNSTLHLAARKGFKELVKQSMPYIDEISMSGRDGQTPLHEAVKGGHEDIVQYLLERGEVDPSSSAYNGRTALHIAAAEGQLGIVTRLIKYRNRRTHGGKRIERFAVSAVDRQNITPLHLAALGSHTKIVQLLLQEGANSSAQDISGETVLHQAISSGDPVSVQLLLDHGAVVECTNRTGVTSLHRAATMGCSDMINILLERKPDISTRVGDRTALELALTGGHEKAVELLRSKGAQPPIPANVDAMLVDAAKDGDIGLVELFLSYDANPSGKPLMAAAEYGHRNVLNLLLSRGADMAMQDEHGWTALHCAANGGHIDIVNLLVSQSGTRNKQDQTPLVLAASNGHEQVVRALLPDPQDGSAMTEDIHPAFFLAARNGHHKATYLLASHGANIKMTDKDGRTAFIIAVEEGHSKVLEILLQFNTDISETTKNGESALFVAARGGHFDIVRMLLEKGANISETNAEGQTALFVAGKHGHRKVYTLLVEKGVNPFVRDRHRNMASIAHGGDNDDPGY